jgi:hypothetical protein
MRDVDIFIEVLRLAEQIGEVTDAVMSSTGFDRAVNGFCTVDLVMKDGNPARLKLEKGDKE